MDCRIRLLVLTAPLFALPACTTLSDKDRAMHDGAAQTAAATKREADQALATAHAALAIVDKTQDTASTVVAQSAADASDIKNKEPPSQSEAARASVV